MTLVSEMVRGCAFLKSAKKCSKGYECRPYLK